MSQSKIDAIRAAHAQAIRQIQLDAEEQDKQHQQSVADYQAQIEAIKQKVKL